MAQIYDVASKLDYSGIEAPARLNAARIAIGQQEAREAPLRFKQTQKEWQRGDEQYAQSQAMLQQQQVFGKAARIAAVSQTPQAFVRNMTQTLGDNIRDPFFSAMLAEATKITDPVAWQNFKADAGSAITNVGNLFASQLKLREEADKQRLITERSIYEQTSMLGREQNLEEQRQQGRMSLEAIKTRNKRAEIQLRSTLQNQGISEAKIADLVPSAQQAFANEFSEPQYETDTKTGERRPVVDDKGQPVYQWREDRPKTQEEIFNWQMGWLKKAAHGINQIVEEEQGGVAPAAQPSGAKPKFSIMGPK